MTAVPPRRRLQPVNLEGAWLVTESADGSKEVPGMSVVADSRGFTLTGPEPGAERTIPWALTTSFTCQRPARLPDGSPATTLEVGLANGRILQLLLPVNRVPPSETVVVETELAVMSEYYGGTRPPIIQPDAAGAPDAADVPTVTDSVSTKGPPTSATSPATPTSQAEPPLPTRSSTRVRPSSPGDNGTRSPTDTGRENAAGRTETRRYGVHVPAGAPGSNGSSANGSSASKASLNKAAANGSSASRSAVGTISQQVVAGRYGVEQPPTSSVAIATAGRTPFPAPVAARLHPADEPAVETAPALAEAPQLDEARAPRCAPASLEIGAPTAPGAMAATPAAIRAATPAATPAPEPTAEPAVEPQAVAADTQPDAGDSTSERREKRLLRLLVALIGVVVVVLIAELVLILFVLNHNTTSRNTSSIQHSTTVVYRVHGG